MGAATPEELDTLLEDALLLADEAALCALFEGTRVVVAGQAGQDALRSLRCRGYVASEKAVRVGHDLALTVSGDVVVISRRGSDLRWRLVAVVVTDLRVRSPAG